MHYLKYHTYVGTYICIYIDCNSRAKAKVILKAYKLFRFKSQYDRKLELFTQQTKAVSTLHPKSIRIESGLYLDWLDPDRMWIHSINTAKFTLLKHVVMLVRLSKVLLHECGGSHSPVSMALLPHPRNQSFHETEFTLL